MLSKNLKIIIIFIFLIIATVGIARIALAQNVDLGLEYGGKIGLGDEDPRIIAANVIRIALGFLGILAICLMIYAGWLYMTARGNQENIDKAKKILMGAVVGLVIILSAFGIASFILSRLLEITDGESGFGGPGGGGFGGPGGGASFYIRSTVPMDGQKEQIRNVAIKVFFNKAIGSGVDLANNFKVEKIADINENTKEETPATPVIIAGEVSIAESRKILNFKAPDNCGDANNTSNCFSPWSKFSVTINEASGIITEVGQGLSCAGGSCYFEFSVNDMIDTGPPTAGIIKTQICYDDGTILPDANYIGGWGKDDAGISGIEFYRNSNLDYDEPGTGKKYQYAEYRAEGFEVQDIGANYNFKVKVEDMADKSGEDSFSATVKQGHCCNGIKDGDETEIDCGEEGGDCELCNSINKDPIIYWLSPGDGAINNFITINGKYFGDTAGEVYFGDVKANLADVVNPKCANGWTDTQIIAVVPAGAISGPIKVERSDNKFDTTDNSNGPDIPNFIVNDETRPGLCAVNPANGYFKDSFTLQGNAFNGNDKTVLFGNVAENIKAGGISGWTNTSVNARVPNISGGRNTIFIKSNNNASNALNFRVEIDASKEPVIEYISPGQGPIGQYITIYGRNFKAYSSSRSSVQFYLPADPNNLIDANIEFPEECQGKWWRDDYVIVKAPEVGQLDDYKVKLTNRDGRASEPADFTITIGEPGPGLCALDPYNGPVGQAVTVYGDNFGSASGKVEFYNKQDSPVRSWLEQKVDANVPGQAVTGPVQVINSSGIKSNGLSFTVGSCSTNDECASADECCGSGTYWSGVCRDKGSCDDGSPNACAYGWTFSTSPDGGNKPCGKDTDCKDNEVCVGDEGKKTCQPGSGNIVVNVIDKITSEANSANTAKFTVKLKYEPADDVVIALASDDITEGMVASPSNATLTFTSVDYNTAQEATVRGVDDNEPDGATAYYIKLTAVSSDANYNGQSQKAELINEDNELEGNGGVLVSTEDDKTSEDGGAEKLSVKLYKAPEDGKAVTVAFASDDATEGAVTNPASKTLTFDLNNYDTEQTVTVTGIDDAETDGNVDYNIELTVTSSSNNYKNMQPGDIDLVNIDNEGDIGYPGAACKKLDESNNLVCDPDFSCGSENYACLGTAEDACGRCCCAPGEINDNGLECIEDNAPCDGANRGLFCGCEKDSECDNINAEGCGFDTCCRGRPKVSSVSPANNSKNVCRNTAITADFNTLMNLSSFSGNVIVADEGCADINTCAVTGSVSGYHNADDTTTLTFSPNGLLAGNKKYYVIIKGDEDLDSSQGVLSYYDIGMKAAKNLNLGGADYTGKIWSFQTMAKQAENNGVCKIDKVEITPKSYLFQTTANALNENDDNPNDDSFDTAADSDKVFTAEAVSVGGYALAPISGVYDWNWSWDSSMSLIADFEIVNGLDSNKRLVRAKADATDGNTTITATAKVGGSMAKQGGEAYAGEADVYVFICENPWPPVKNGVWRPWTDKDLGMSCIGKGDCVNVNYEFYYCRDAGADGTADDLPAILSEDTIIRGKSDDILKESYFFRE